MSDKDFNKKIRQKLYEHQSDYDPKAWEKMKSILPAPWYASFLQTYGGWLWGALASTALVFTFFYQNTKNNELYDQISTLKSQMSVVTADSVFIEKTNTDTLYVTQYIDRVVKVPVYIQDENNDATTENSRKAKSLENTSNKINNKGFLESDQLENELESSSLANTGGSNAEEIVVEIKDEEITSSNTISNKTINPGQVALEKQIEREVIEITKNAELGSQGIDNQLEDNESSVKDEKDLEKSEIEKEEIAQENVTEAQSELKTEVTEAIPTKKGKKFTLPKMRLGITSDYMGLNVLANGINTEFFLFDKLSVNTSLIFSGLVETRHQLLADFNRKTGKDFRKEFERFNPRIPERVKDITIQTSFVRLPVHFNYYISTWSRFKFMISAGTKLDLSVYQDIDFNSSASSTPIRNRFEAKPQPKVLNNLNYGMGLEYQYRGFVGQLMPYFDFNFRQTDYFTPRRKFGIVGSLKYQLGK